MHICKTLRRLHVPIICVLTAAIVVTTCMTGCSTSRNRDYGKENVYLGKPTRALLAQDGTLLLSFYIERRQQPGHAGWHWLVVEPGAVGIMFDPHTLNNKTRCDWDTLKIIWAGEDANARMVPPLLEPGMSDNQTPPMQDQNLTQWRLKTRHHAGSPHLTLAPYDTSTLDPCKKPIVEPTLSFSPTSMAYQSTCNRLRELTARIFSVPVQIGKFALKATILTCYFLLDTYYQAKH